MIKKTILISILLLLFQFSFGQDVFRKGKTGINIGAGYRALGDVAIGGNFSIERSVYEIKRFGYVGIDLTTDVLRTIEGEEIIPSGTFRTLYHAGFFRTNVLDIYSGLGVAIAKKNTEKSTLLHPDIFLGFRVKFSKKSKLGFFGEFGYYAANYKAGLCFIL